MKRFDILVYIFILVIAIALWFTPFFFSTSELQLLVITDTQTFSYDLDTNREFTLQKNGITIEIAIENRTVFVRTSNCPNQMCVHTGAIEREYQSILCAPAKVLIQIVAKEASLDGISH